MANAFGSLPGHDMQQADAIAGPIARRDVVTCAKKTKMFSQRGPPPRACWRSHLTPSKQASVLGGKPYVAPRAARTPRTVYSTDLDAPALASSATTPSHSATPQLPVCGPPQKIPRHDPTRWPEKRKPPRSLCAAFHYKVNISLHLQVGLPLRTPVFAAVAKYTQRRATSILSGPL